MTGYPDFNRARFREVAEKIRSFGYHVHNPGDFTIDGWSWKDYITHDKCVLKEGGFDLIVLLEGWQKSKGCYEELEYAKELDIATWELDAFMEMHPFIEESIDNDNLLSAIKKSFDLAKDIVAKMESNQKKGQD
jgi:hypothetical protein